MTLAHRRRQVARASLLAIAMLAACARAPGGPPRTPDRPARDAEAPGHPQPLAPLPEDVESDQVQPEDVRPPTSQPQDCSRAERLRRHAARLYDPGERTHVLERAVELCPEDVSVLVALASAYEDEGEHGLAASLARRALTLEPGHPGARRLLDSVAP